MIYYVFISCFVGAVGAFMYKSKYESVGNICIIGAIILFAGLRGDFTSDYKNYALIYDSLENRGWRDILLNGSGQEMGFTLFTKLFTYFNAETMYIFILSAITIILFAISLRKYSRAFWLSILFFVAFGSYYTSFNIIRNIFAGAISFIGVRYIISREPIKYMACILCAMLFHTTAFIMLPMYFVLNIHVTKKNCLLFGALGIIGFVTLPAIINVVRNVIPRYAVYADNAYGMSAASIGNIVVPITMLFLVVLSYFLVDKNKFSFNYIENRVLINGFIMYVIFSLFGLKIYLLLRLSDYFSPFVWVLLPNLIVNYKLKDNYNIIIIAVFLLAIIYPFVTLSDTGYDPYYFFWN